MIATAQVTSTASIPTAVEAPVAITGTSALTRSDVLRGHDAVRERELDLMAANVESAAEGLAIFLLLALFATAFVVATLTGVLA